jgi:hypothetical protein
VIVGNQRPYQSYGKGFIPKERLLRKGIEMQHKGSETPGCGYSEINGKYFINSSFHRL